MPTDISQAKQMLVAMTHVHRTWTQPSQHALGTRVCMDGCIGLMVLWSRRYQGPG